MEILPNNHAKPYSDLVAEEGESKETFLRIYFIEIGRKRRASQYLDFNYQA
jgi:hypothetical protein